MKLLFENWREFLLENAPIGDISSPHVYDEMKTTYDLQIGDNKYIVKLRKQSHGAPRDVSFNVEGAENYELTGNREVFAIVNSVIAIVKDFINLFPEETSFQFTGAEETAGEGGEEATRRTRVYIGLLKRAIKKDAELSSKIKSMGDLSWAGDPNTFKINLSKELKHETPI